MKFASTRFVAIGEAMLEMAPVGDGQFRMGYAGDTFNTLWHAAQLLGERGRAGFVTRLGTDRLSDRFAAEMETDGLDLSGVSRDPERQMGLYIIELDGAERSFHYWRDFSAARRLADDPVALDSALAGAGLIHVSGITLAILSPSARASLFDALDKARRAGARVSFDPNIRPRLWASTEASRAAVTTMLARTDIALPSFDDEAALWGDASPAATITRLRDLGVAEAAVKDGPRQVRFHARGVQGVCETRPVTDLRDTTGAGDAFNAGYLSARLIGSSQTKAIGAGQALSALVLATPGARAPRAAVREMSGIISG
ncbi:MAG: sugar kinase [Maritimibacter sp.]|nr:sugar kinase [Maritimibacter sp.]